MLRDQAGTPSNLETGKKNFGRGESWDERVEGKFLGEIFYS